MAGERVVSEDVHHRRPGRGFDPGRARRLYPDVSLGRSYFLPSHRVFYVTNQKCGCSTIKIYLTRVHTQDFAFDVEDIHRNRVVPSPRAIGWRVVREAMREGGFLFTFVRDPWDRLVSAYRDKMRRPRWRGEIGGVLGRADPTLPVSFPDFVQAIAMQDVQEMDPHWRPQHRNLMVDALSFDFIGRMEDFGRDFERLKALAGLPDAPIPHKNRSSRELDLPREPATLRRVEEIYARDYELFGY